MYNVSINHCYLALVYCYAYLFVSLPCLVPPPHITVSVDPAVDPIYSSTAVNLTCTALLAEEVDTATVATATWTSPISALQPTDRNRISVTQAISVGERMFESILVFEPVDFQKDSGLHTCQMDISSNVMSAIEDHLILPVVNNNSTSLTPVGKRIRSPCIIAKCYKKQKLYISYNCME